MLEYYEGLLFITTNRLEDFDEAFHNRIQVPIAYVALSAEFRTNIWRWHVQNATQHDKSRGLWTDDAFSHLGMLETNGRDIRNAVQIASAYAQAERETSSAGPGLSLRHILNYVRNSFDGQKLEDASSTLKKLDELSFA
jgi:hypothetical protein